MTSGLRPLHGQAFLDCTAWKVAVIPSSGCTDSGAPVGLWEGGGRTMMGRQCDSSLAPLHQGQEKTLWKDFFMNFPPTGSGGNGLVATTGFLSQRKLS